MNRPPTQDPHAGKLIHQSIGNPAAGANFTWTSPTHSNWEIIAVHFALTTDANAANRIARLRFRDAATDVLYVLPSDIQVASKTAAYYFAQGFTNTLLTNTLSLRNGALPINLICYQTWNLSSEILDIQAGDQLTAIEIIFKRYIYF